MKHYKYKVHSRNNDIFIIGQYDELNHCEAIFKGKANWQNGTFDLKPEERYRKWVNGYTRKTVYMEDVKPMEAE